MTGARGGTGRRRTPKPSGTTREGSSPSGRTNTPVCPDCGPLDYSEVLEDGDRLFCGLCGEDLPDEEDEGVSEDRTEPAEAFEGLPDRECGEHRTTGPRAWCFACTEWCYPEEPCKGCELPTLRSALAAAREESGRLREVLVHALDRYECDFPNEENETDCGNCTRCLMRAALAREPENMAEAHAAPTIAGLLRMHQAVADTLDESVTNQNDFRFALLGVVTEVAEAIQHLPWRPWRTADRRPPTSEELDAAIPELADALGALLRGVVNLGIDPERFEQACVEHISVKFERIRSGQDG